jgi:hypothetical protein
VSWQEAIAIVVILMGLGAAAFLVGQRPAFWIEFGSRLLARLWPSIVKYVTKRMPPEEEAEWRKAELRGRGDEWLRERWRKKRKGIFR